MKRINADEVEEIAARLTQSLEARGEWLCTENRASSRVSLQRGEWEFRVAHRRLLFSYLDERGARVLWRVAEYDLTTSEAEIEKITLVVERRAGAERATLEIIPRARVSDDKRTVAAARRLVCERLAKYASEFFDARVERAGLSRGATRSEPGRFARIILRRGRREILAVTGDVAGTDSLDADAMLASALLWLARLTESKRMAGASVHLYFVAVPEIARTLAELCALLRASVRRQISVYETNDDYTMLALVSIPSMEDVLHVAPAPRAIRSPDGEASEWAQNLIALAPDAIDAVRSRHGETLRFHGLAFARVRVAANRTHIWFGVDRVSMRRTVLNEDAWPELLKLVEDLCESRRASGDHTHALFRAAPEAWLESILRRDVTRLDPGLVVSPIHAQFRAGRSGLSRRARPVDLLALRNDGRLVVIELKASEDAALPFQAADYFRRVEIYRRAGAIRDARLFGDRVIADTAPLIYAVAPGLRFARSFEILARTLAPEIEIYRFDINEDWRAGVRVMRRARANGAETRP